MSHSGRDLSGFDFLSGPRLAQESSKPSGKGPGLFSTWRL